MSYSRGETELEELLREVDEVARSSSAPGDEDDDGDDPAWEPYWAAWRSLPLRVRDWLLWAAPGWYVLPAGPFRRLLLYAAGLIVWSGLPPRAALLRAGTGLRLPPPRRGARIASRRWPRPRPWRLRPALRRTGGFRPVLRRRR